MKSMKRREVLRTATALAVGGAGALVLPQSVAAQARVIDGVTHAILSTQLLGSTSYTGAVSVAIGDITGDRISDIALGTDENGPRAQVVRGGDFRKIADIAGSATDFRGGTQVGLGDMNGDGKAELVVSGTYANESLVRGYMGSSLSPGVVPVEAFSAFTLAGGYSQASGVLLWLASTVANAIADALPNFSVSAALNLRLVSVGTAAA